jgi:hypothetical protein
MQRRVEIPDRGMVVRIGEALTLREKTDAEYENVEYQDVRI